MTRGSALDRRRPRCLLVPAWIATLLLLCVGTARPDTFSADAIKAAYLHRFAAYVEWPAEGTGSGAFVIGVYRAEGVVEQLRRFLPELSIHGRSAEVRVVRSPDDLRGVSILYVGPGHARRARELISRAREAPTLIVSDDTGGLRLGSAINFIQVGQNVRFEVSQAAAERSGLSISSALLAVAQRVETRP